MGSWKCFLSFWFKVIEQKPWLFRLNYRTEIDSFSCLIGHCPMYV
jgi:hypothetical protein